MNETTNPTAGYAGEIDVTDAWERLRREADAVLVDVRTVPEWNYVGLPDLSSANKQVVCNEWQSFPGMNHNPDFEPALARAGIAKDAAIFLLCRSGVRSLHAAKLLTAAGYQRCYNVTGGFEGDGDGSGHRGRTGGWKFAGLPWRQG